jgi:hypothetical protein
MNRNRTTDLAATLRTNRSAPFKTRVRLWAPCVLAVLLVVVGSDRQAVAHHSFAMYDTTKVVIITGTVKEFQWTNPHALLWVVGSSDGGPGELWTIELPTSPGNLARMGWTKHSLATGDALAVEVNPLRDGSRGGSFKKATLTTTGLVLVATAKDDPYAGDAGAATDASATSGGLASVGGTASSSVSAAHIGCSYSGGPPPPSAGLQGLIAMSLTAAMLARKRKYAQRAAALYRRSRITAAWQHAGKPAGPDDGVVSIEIE